MTQTQYIIGRKLNVLELGKTLGNISDACRKLGISRQHYYDIKKAIEEEGLEGLLEKSRKGPRSGTYHIICSVPEAAPGFSQKGLVTPWTGFSGLKLCAILGSALRCT